MKKRNRLDEYSSNYCDVLEKIIDELPIPISIVGSDELFALVNKCYESLFDIHRDELLGKHYSCHVTDEQSIHKRIIGRLSPQSGTKIMGAHNSIVQVEGVPIMGEKGLICSACIIHEFSNTERTMSELGKQKKAVSELSIDSARYSFDDIIGTSPVLQSAITAAKNVSATNVTILLRGESGTGKELFAHAIHKESARANQKFIRINCSAIPESLLESILFGYEDSSFTGAKKGGEIGLFEAAENGTIFLDEIGDISLSLQSKLLRVLQEREIKRVGSVKTKIINVRVIAATNANLEDKIERREFRSDLYYRLNTFPVHIPALRERKSDIPALASHFLNLRATEFGKDIRQISDSCLDFMDRYDWPGNVRELDNIITRAIISKDSSESVLTADDIRPYIKTNIKASSSDGAAADDGDGDYRSRFEAWERAMLESEYAKAGRSKTALAGSLGLSVRSVYDKLKKYDIV